MEILFRIIGAINLFMAAILLARRTDRLDVSMGIIGVLNGIWMIFISPLI